MCLAFQLFGLQVCHIIVELHSVYIGLCTLCIITISNLEFFDSGFVRRDVIVKHHLSSVTGLYVLYIAVNS